MKNIYFEANSELIIPCVKSRDFYGVTYMLVVRRSKTFNVFLNLKFDRKAALPVVDFQPRILFSTEKFFFLWLINTGVKPLLIKISLLKLTKLLNSCWPIKAES